MSAPLTPSGSDEPASGPIASAGTDDSADTRAGDFTDWAAGSADLDAAEADAADMTEPAAAYRSRRPGRRVATGPSRFATILVAVLAASAIFLGGYTLGAHIATTPGTPASEEDRFAPFWDVYSAIQNDYAGSPRPSPDDLVRAAIDRGKW